MDGKFFKAERVSGVLRHETGHAVDALMGGSGPPFSENSRFTMAYMADVERMDSRDAKQLQYVLQRGKAGPSETFAEIFALLNGGPCNDAAAEPLERSFVEVSKIVKAKLDELETKKKTR